MMKSIFYLFINIVYSPKAWKDDHVYYNLKKKDWVK